MTDRIDSNDPALREALTPIVGDVSTVCRVVIDIKAGSVPMVHIERIGDASVIDVVRTLQGLEISRALSAHTLADQPISNEQEL